MTDLIGTPGFDYLLVGTNGTTRVLGKGGGDWMEFVILNTEQFLLIETAAEAPFNHPYVVSDFITATFRYLIPFPVVRDSVDLTALGNNLKVTIASDLQQNSYLSVDLGKDGTQDSLIIFNNFNQTGTYAYNYGQLAFEQGVAVLGGDNLLLAPGAPGVTILGSDAGDGYLRGSAMADTIAGYGGIDRIDGFGGSDLLYGGQGADRFVISNAVANSTLAAPDYILDFQPGQDKLILPDAAPAGVFLSEFAGSTFVYLDYGFDNSADALVILAGVTGVGYSDVAFGFGGSELRFATPMADRFTFKDFNNDPDPESWAFLDAAGSTPLNRPDVIFDFQPGIDKIVEPDPDHTGTFISELNGSTYVYFDTGLDNVADALVILRGTVGITYGDVVF